MSKVAIVSINDRVVLHGKTARSLDCIWLKKYIQQTTDHEVFYVSHKILELNEDDSVLSFDETDLKEFDEIYVINSMIHFIGGDIKRHTMKIIKDLARFGKPINVLFTDPKMWFINFPQKIYSGSNLKYKDDLRITEEDIDLWSKMDLRALWTGNDYLKYANGINRKYHQHIAEHKNIPFFEFIFMNQDFPKNENAALMYDVCYWGDKRQGDRQKKIKKFLDNPNFSKLFIGQDPGFENSVAQKKLPRKETMETIRLSIAALIVGDNEHDGNIVTFRFFEAIKMGLVAFIDKDFDPQQLLLKDPLLQKVCYVENSEDIEKRIAWLKNSANIKNVVALQNKELEKWGYLKIK